MKFKTIILDFDGTIVESVGIKDQAFRELFRGYPECLDRIMDYHLAHNATIRYDKFQYITENILGQVYTEEAKQRLSGQFSDLVFERIVNCPYVNGARDFLEYFCKKVPLYLASVNPELELERILAGRGLKAYFKKVYSHPSKKKDVIRDIMALENISAEEVVFIGDTPEDYRAAAGTGAFFIGRDSDKSFSGADILLFKDFADITTFLKQEI